MKPRTILSPLVLAAGLLFYSVGCTDLTDTVDSQVTAETFFQNDQQFVSAMGDAYSRLTALGGGGSPAQFNEATTDEIIVPARGQDWSEGGFWYRVNSHSWTEADGTFNGFWNTYFSGINNANRLIFQFESAVESGAADPALAETFISELVAMRAFYYFWLLDAFGNVPIVTSFVDAEEKPSQPSSNFAEGRRMVFQFVEKELLDNVGNLSTDTRGTYGRMNQYVARMTLAKLYMNAEVYTGTGRWGDALTQLNEIINSGQYSLAANYHDNFAVQNDGSPENIFVVPYDKVFLTGLNLHQMTLHYGSQNTYNFQFQPWNGWSATQKMYESVIDPMQNPGPQGEVWGSEPTSDDAGLERVMGTLDDRLGNFLVGPQYTSGGERITDSGIYSDFDRNGSPLTFTPAMNDLEAVACRQCGARIGKYAFENGIGSSGSNDFVIYRYADVLLLKAEALWRMNAGSAEALALVNQIRMRSGVDPFMSLDADKLIGERGRELFWEQTRRQDLIRFAGVEGGETRYNDPWQFKPISESWRNVAPIPRNQLEANSNLVQNPGY
ncbi:MAG: RagB/SusD family nutrient uptake outer membrane protein [Bacteroidetes bacterium]|nr:RagB/SusD family nutrient uptake outer membrane protein [Bacteroidota bacterium]MDE2671647.1 RagB/SusD family nutrient uptake outer membrane protein [Bacteroidota bacterium]